MQLFSSPSYLGRPQPLFHPRLTLCVRFFIQGREFQDSFAFDKVFGMETEQQEIFEYSIKSIVDGAFISCALRDQIPNIILIPAQ